MTRFLLVVLAFGACAITPALAASGADIAAKGMPTGVPACSSCHGVNGEGQPGAGIPRLAGLNATYIVHQLASFSAGARKNDIMDPIAKALPATARKTVADYYAGLTPKKVTASAPSDAKKVAIGMALAEYGDWSKGMPGCRQCHGADGNGVGSAFPRLAGQTADYIEAQLEAFQKGTRANDPMGLMENIAKKLDKDQIAAVASYYAALPDLPASVEPAAQPAMTQTDGFTPPPDSAIPNDEFGKMVRLGENIFRDTQKYAAQYVGNTLNCQNCHLDGGRLANSAPLWAAFVNYPAYRSKNKHVNTYAERMQGCFRYSMNGKVPALGSKTLVALETYSYFLAKGAPVGTQMKGRGYPALANPAEPMSYARGKTVYEQSCALCHGANGAGQMSTDGKQAFPALWGPKSFNWGAGMGNIKNAAAFIHANMPFSQGMTLSEQDAWDVAMFVDGHDRPQDPRFTGSVSETRKKFHNSAMWMYGKTVNGVVLGAHSPPSGRR